MGEDQELKHVCKFCNKSFSCGRSLGGHMRSHMNNNNNSVEIKDDKLCKKKLVTVNNGGNGANTETGSEAGINGGYILRENPKKTWRLADHSSEDTSVVHDKLCKECGKGFQSWKALFGHMKCHSDKERGSNNSLEDQDSWTSASQKLDTYSQSDNETAAPNKKRRSKRRTRYMGTANSSTLSSMSEIEQEQEEVALSLMMLSRDVSHWGGLNSVAESSDHNSVFLEAKFEIKASICNPKVVQKLKKQKVKKLESAVMDSETFQTGAEQSEFCSSGLYEVELSKKSVIQTGVDRSKRGSNKLNPSMRKSQDQSYDPELKSGSLNKLKTDVLDSDEFCKDPQKRRKFECTTCNKIFHSYQALGGHRASHKMHPRLQFKPPIETETSLDPTADSKVVKSIGKETPAIDNLVEDNDDYKGEVSYRVIKKSKGHECPICLKVFPSGQALGGHKRSHFIAEAKENQNQTIVMQNPIPEIRDFLDLNLPAPVEEEASGVHVGFKPWWVFGSSSSHKHEPLLGLISN